MTEQRPPEYPTLQHYQPSPFILPEETLPLRVARDHVPYDRWEQQGYLQTTKAMLSTTGTSNGSLMLWGRNSTSKKLHMTVGERCRWYRTLRGWDLL